MRNSKLILVLLVILSVTVSIGGSRKIQILPIGDSITEGGGDGGYRIKLYDKLTQCGIDCAFVGTQTTGATSGESGFHEGHSGWTIKDIDDYIGLVLEKLKPDHILLMIGTNDLWEDKSVQGALARLDLLITTLRIGAPQAQILVSSIPPVEFKSMQLRVDEYNSGIVSLLLARIQTDSDLHYVDAGSQIPIAELPDGLHPGENGYTRMAQIWYESVCKLQSCSPTNVASSVRPVQRNLKRVHGNFDLRGRGVNEIVSPVHSRNRNRIKCIRNGSDRRGAVK